MYAKDELLNSDNDRQQLIPTVTLDLCVSSRSYRQLTFTRDQIQLSSLSQNSIQVVDYLQKLQVMFQPSLILKLSNMILSRCGALVSFSETSRKQKEQGQQRLITL